MNGELGAKYRGLLEAAPDAMVVVNEGGEIVLLNLQAEKQFGYRRDELVGQRVTNIIPEGFAERLIADGTRTAADALAQQIGTGIELTGRRKDGSKFPIEIMLSPLQSAEGILVTAAIRDISVRKDAEKHLAQMEARYRGLLEAAPDAMVVVNEGGEIVLLNLQAEKQFGYRRDELVGQRVTNIIPEGFAERLIADGTRTAADALAQQIGTGIELTGRRKDGSKFPIEIMLSPLQNAEGILVTAAIRDVSVRKDAEKHLAQMEGKYRGLLEAAPDAMVVVNEGGEVVLLNLQAEKQFGYRRDELVGQRVTNIIPEGFAERLIADGTRTAADALAQQIGTGIELTGRRKDGSKFPIEIMLSPLQSAEGILVTAAIRDISVRTKAEAHLLQSELEAQGLRNDLAHAGRVATIGELTTSLAHELNQPLTAILSNAQAGQRVLETAPVDLEEVAEILKDIVEDDKRAGEVIRRLRRLLRKGVPQMRALDLNEALGEVARLVSADAVVRGVSIRLELADGLPPVVGDRVQLQQVALNLVLNGMDAMREAVTRDRVLVFRTARASVKSVRVEVRDSGAGINEGDMDKIFRAFYTTKPDGMGMGLAITRSIVEVHGGRLEARNNPDGGATFSFTLPIEYDGGPDGP